MKVRRYIDLIKGVNDTIGTSISILKESGATEAEAVLALMVTRDISMDEAQHEISNSKLFPAHPPDDHIQKKKQKPNVAR